MSGRRRGSASAAWVSTLVLVSVAWATTAQAASATVQNATELTAAIAAAGPGDTITLLDGSFLVSTPILASAAGSVNAPIRVTSAHGAHGAIIVAGAGADAAVRVSGPFWIFDGVDFDGATYGVRVVAGGNDVVIANARVRGTVAGVRADCGGPDSAAHCDRGTLNGVDVTGSATTPGCSFAGVEIVGGVDWRVRGSSVHDVVVDTLSCPVATSYGIVARGNAQRLTVESVRVAGVGIGLALGPGSDPCEVRGTTQNGTSCTAATACAAQTSTLRNVVVHDTTDVGVLLQNACGVNVHGATLWNDGTAANGKRSVESRATGASDVSDTILNGPIVVGVGTMVTGGGNLTLPTGNEPSWFLDAAGGNFRLADLSPAIDTGVALGDLPFDYDGLGRPQGSAFDVGAFERPTGGYPDGGLPMTDGGTDGAVGPGGATGGLGGGGTAPPKGGCQCTLSGGNLDALAPLLLLLLALLLLARRRV
ncbi:MAG: Fibronectin type protein [Myxococcales bacterium]|nr:Fibronectin type protein [Myxococcales bacterium]